MSISSESLASSFDADSSVKASGGAVLLSPSVSRSNRLALDTARTVKDINSLGCKNFNSSILFSSIRLAGVTVNNKFVKLISSEKLWYSNNLHLVPSPD